MTTDAHIRQIEVKLKEIREALAPVGSRQMHLSGREGSDPWRHVNEERPAGSNAAVLLGRKATDGLLEVTTSSDIYGSVFDDTIVQR